MDPDVLPFLIKLWTETKKIENSIRISLPDILSVYIDTEKSPRSRKKVPISSCSEAIDSKDIGKK